MPFVTNPQVLAKLRERLRTLRPNTPARWGMLSAGEMVCHLHDAATSVLARAGGEIGPGRPLLKWVALRSGLPWPKGAPTPAHVDPRRDGTRPGDFVHDRERAIASLEALAAAAPDALPNSHAVFGRMTPEDWWHWGYRHTHHHLRQFGL